MEYTQHFLLRSCKYESMDLLGNVGERRRATLGSSRGVRTLQYNVEVSLTILRPVI